MVPQSLGEGLCSFITDLIAPHPEGRGKTEKVSDATLYFLLAPMAGLYTPQACVSAPPREPWPGDEFLHLPLSELLWGSQIQREVSGERAVEAFRTAARQRVAQLETKSHP